MCVFRMGLMRDAAVMFLSMALPRNIRTTVIPPADKTDERIVFFWIPKRGHLNILLVALSISSSPKSALHTRL